MCATKEHAYARDSLTRMWHVGKSFHAKMLVNTKNATVGTRTSVVLQHDEPDQNIKHSTVAYRLLLLLDAIALPPPPLALPLDALVNL